MSFFDSYGDPIRPDRRDFQNHPKPGMSKNIWFHYHHALTQDLDIYIHATEFVETTSDHISLDIFLQRVLERSRAGRNFATPTPKIETERETSELLLIESKVLEEDGLKIRVADTVLRKIKNPYDIAMSRTK